MASFSTLSDVSRTDVLRLSSEEELDEGGQEELEEEDTGAEGILVEGRKKNERAEVPRPGYK